MHSSIEHLVHTFLCFHYGEPELFGPSGHRIFDDIGLSDGNKLAEVVCEVLVCCLEGQPSNKDLLVCVVFELLRFLIFLEGVVTVNHPTVDDMLRAQDTLISIHVVTRDESVAFGNAGFSIADDQNVENKTKLGKVVKYFSFSSLDGQSADE